MDSNIFESFVQVLKHEQTAIDDDVADDRVGSGFMHQSRVPRLARSSEHGCVAPDR